MNIALDYGTTSILIKDTWPELSNPIIDANH